MKNIYKAQLSDLLAKGHAKFGKVALRKPYRDEDEDDGGTASGLTLLEHPLLMNVPIGAASDLTINTNANSEAVDEALDRAEECCPQLKQQPALRKALALGRHYTPAPRPNPL